jgi:glycosyltransferase involved in cell wall biosynthesis
VTAARPDVELVLQTPADLPAPEGVRVVRRLSHAELRDLYARASLVAVAARPNLHVSGMTVSLEAMATGRPVVVTGTPGMATYVEDGVTGLHAPVGDAEAMAAHILRLLDDPAAAVAMGTAGRRRVEDEFTTRRMALRLAEFVGLR